MATADDELRRRMRTAATGLQDALTSVAADVVARIDARCPYRAREDRCTFAGPCRNRRRDEGPGEPFPRCAGDQALRRPAP